MSNESYDRPTVLWSFSHEESSAEQPGPPVTLADDQLLKELAGELRARQSAADQLEERAASALGVHRTAARCVELLIRKGPLSAGELSAKLGLSPSGTTPLLDRLEEAGTVRRVRPPEGDRRRITIELTADGRAVAQGVWENLYEPLARLANEYERNDLELVLGFLRRANAILGGDTADIAEQTPPATPPPVDRPLPEPAAEERTIFRSRRPSRPANRLR